MYVRTTQDGVFEGPKDKGVAVSRGHDFQHSDQIYRVLAFRNQRKTSVIGQVQAPNVGCIGGNRA